MSRKIIIFIFMFFLIPSSLMVKDTHAYWVNPNDGECMFTGVVDLGYWRRIPILEKVRIISNPKMGDEFFYQDELYVVINNSVTEITDDAEWWVNNNPWNGVNLVSTNWVTNNYYDQYFLPIRHNDSYWLAHSSEASGIEPGTTVSWFKIDEGYIPENHYPKNYIICYGDNNGPRYWIASQNIQPNNAPDKPNSGWVEIMPWVSGIQYRKDEILYRYDTDGSVRFWMAIKNTWLEPCVAAAMAREYWEIQNAWIRSKNASVENYWIEHNVYRKDDIVAFGCDNCQRFRYFTCTKNNIMGYEPFSIINGEEIVNTNYWQEIY